MFIVLAAAVPVTVIVFLCMFAASWGLLATSSGFRPPDKQVLPAVLTAAISLTALIGASFGAVYAFRKQLLTERDGARADQQVFTDRYVKAAELLAHDQPSARLAGLDLLAVLADDWSEGRQTCVMAICSYLRLPPRMATDHGAEPGEREVRRTAWRLIRDRLQDRTKANSWHAFEFDFSGAEISDMDLEAIEMSDGVLRFHRCSFEGGTIRLNGARLHNTVVDFEGARFANMTVQMQACELTGKSVFNLDRAAIDTSVFFGERTSIGARARLTAERSRIAKSRFSFDPDGMHFFRGGGDSTIEGEVSFEKAKLSDVTVQMYTYTVSGRFVFAEARTENVEISVPKDIIDPRDGGQPYINLDVFPLGLTEINIGPGKMERGDLRIRPNPAGTSTTLTLSIRDFASLGGHLLIHAMGHDLWRSFELLLAGDQHGAISIMGPFPHRVKPEISRHASIDRF